MELHQLRYFLAVVDEGSFTAAAHAVRISQSGVSTQLQKLERELGVTLVDRSARRVALTPAGARLVPYARTAVAAVDDVTGAANAIRGLVVGSLRVATVTGMVWEPLFDGLTTLHAEHPGIDIRLQEGASDDLVAQVRAGTVDVAVAAWADREPDGLRVSVVFDDPLVAVVGHGHPWAARGSIRPAELARAALIALPDGTGARAALSALMTRTGKPVQPRLEVATPRTWRTHRPRPGRRRRQRDDCSDWVDVVALRIDDQRARSRLGIVWRHRPSHAAQALLRRLVPQEGDRPARAE
jgi:DNA-binding transcriptional LysR family regulator